ncbi:hypothetical protein CES85_4966 [Ochrobactrum quorumnocens]|uniref:Uncharacterized protein n=1 Tax=Ochrobactrum quorumnocens TaxID=271865 RepID=A0A248UBW1_9HYPH|nr:hypothetical protein CES85_4966 [[Ochrobactrum] quorumnocens]
MHPLQTPGTIYMVRPTPSAVARNNPAQRPQHSYCNDSRWLK